jgi:hypothetical protein
LAKKQSKPKVRVADLPWNASVEGVLKHALELHAQHHFTDVVVVGVRKQEPNAVTPIDILHFTSDRFRIVGIMRYAIDRILGR